MQSRIFKGVASAAVVAVLISGCSSTKAPEPTATPSASQTQEPTETSDPVETETPEPTATAEPVKEFKVGDVIDITEKDQLPEGFKAHTVTNDATYVVNVNEPLPEPVLEGIRVQVDAIYGDEPFDNASAARSIVSGLTRSTGKKVIFITQARTVDGIVWTMVSSGNLKIKQKSMTKDGVTAEVEAAIAAQDNPENFELVILDK